MANLTVYANTSAMVDISSPAQNFSTDLVVTNGDLLCSYGEFPIDQQFKNITEGNVFFYLTLEGISKKTLSGWNISFLSVPFDEKTVTYNNQPSTANGTARIYAYLEKAEYISGSIVGISLPAVKNALRYGSRVGVPVQCGLQTSRGPNKPYIVITYEDVDVGLNLSKLSPASGSIVPANPTIFTWEETESGVCYADVTRVSATFRWRNSENDTVKEIQITGHAKSITVPANTFSGDSIQWQITIDANSGVTTTSDWHTLSLEDATSTAVALAPVSEVIDGDVENVFEWSHIISTGTAQTKADLQKSVDGESWTTLATVSGPDTIWSCPSGTFASGKKYWRVRTYNSCEVAGAWSEPAQFVVVAPPPAPSIQIKSTGPRPSISWQTSEQEAYQVELDGTLSGGTRYGTEKSWTSPAYLADGSHTVRVRVQNQYGMWSDWGAAALPVTNTPGAAIALNVEASSIAELSWQTTGSYDFYLVYRDGKPIAKLAQTQYTDELSSGSVSYQVRGCYDDSGNYGISAEVSVQVLADVHMVSDLDTGETLRLPYSDSQHRQTTRTLSRQVELLPLSGAYYPVAVEVDSGTDTLTITAALTDDEQVRKLMGLVGKLVCAKTPQGDMVIGYITSLPKQHDGFLNVFSFTVEQIDYDDEVTL